MKTYKYKVRENESIEFRAMSAEEADRFYMAAKSSNAYAEEFIFNTITNNKYNIDELNAGIIIHVIYASFKMSGYYSKQEDIPDSIDNARKAHENNVYLRMFYSKIMKIFPAYKLEDLKDKTLNELLELIVLSETVLENKIFDTNKIREALKEDCPTSLNKKNKKVLNLITKEELASLKASLQSNETEDGSPIDSI